MSILGQSQAAEYRALAAKDLDFFAGLVVPDIATLQFPDFYKSLWLLCIQELMSLTPDKKLFKLLLVLPRGHGKTIFIKLLIVYAIIHGLSDFPMVLCAGDKNATNFMEDVCDRLSHPNIKALYGDWQAGLVEDNKQQKVCDFMGRRVMIWGLSILSGELRGTQRSFKRPDLIIFDDVQTKADSESELLSAKKADAIIGTAIPAASPHRCGIIYIGNSYPENCIADLLGESGEFVTMRTGAILADGTALWPELHSVKSLYASWKLTCALGKGHLWIAEHQNQSKPQDAGIEPLFPTGDFALTTRNAEWLQVGGFVTIDPAGNSKRADDTAICGHRVYEDGTIELAEIIAAKLNPMDCILAAVAMAERCMAPVIFSEAAAYQATLCFWANRVLQDLQLEGTLLFLPISPSNQRKLVRIRAWVGELLGGAYVVCDPDVKAKVLYQGMLYKFNAVDNNDNILDGAAYGAVVRNLHMQLVTEHCAYVYGNNLGSQVADSVRTTPGGLSRALSALYGNSRGY